MVDFFQRITENQGSLEDLVRKIPGFSGYFEKEDRRAADSLLREHIVNVFEGVLKEYTRLQSDMVDAGGIMYMEKARSVDTKIRMFIDRVSAASQGHAGLFDAVKIKEEALARVYAYDNTLLVYADQLKAGLEQFRVVVSSGEGYKDVLSQLEAVSVEANEAFLKRDEAMKGLLESV